MDDIIKAEEIMRIYSRLDSHDKDLLILFLLNDYQYSNIIRVLGQQYTSIRETIEKSQHSFAADFAANIAGNVVTDGLFFALSRLLRI